MFHILMNLCSIGRLADRSGMGLDLKQSRRVFDIIYLQISFTLYLEMGCTINFRGTAEHCLLVVSYRTGFLLAIEGTSSSYSERLKF